MIGFLPHALVGEFGQRLFEQLDVTRRNGENSRVNQAPLTFSQWCHWKQLTDHPNVHASLSVQYELEGDLDVAAFVDALSNVVKNHDALRIGLVTGDYDGRPEQWRRPVPTGSDLVACRSVRATSRAQFDRYVRSLVIIEFGKPWNLTDSYPFRMFLLKYSESLFVFVGVFSHLAMDARGREIFHSELWKHYDSRSGAGPERGCADRSFLASARRRAEASAEGAAAFWRSKAKSIPPRFLADPGEQGDHRSDESIVISGGALAELRRMALRSRSTEFQWILTAYAKALFGLAPQDAIKVHMPVDTREPDEHETIGMFATALPFVIRRSPDTREMGAQIRREMADVLAHRYVSPLVITEVARTAAEHRGVDWRNDVGINYTVEEEHVEARDCDRVAVRSDVYEPNLRFVNEGVSLEISSSAEQLVMKLTYAPDSPVIGGPGGLGDSLRSHLSMAG
ncbi:condensation domain-containing protein [Nocardia barduliensis]|uniref:condensation domain-containing protein n=1 Tax=Nocardia barduliensis TaxID=2736643 RepID=UPI001572D239|nr:condensation domain-containing protein [Nocardia barduliensis]